MKIHYYNYKKSIFICPNCSWEGIGEDTEIGEIYDISFGIDCPICHEEITEIIFPTSEEMLRYGSEEEKAQAKKELEWREKVLSFRLKDVSQLPEIEDENIKFVLTPIDDEFLAIKFKNKTIWKELRTYEYYDRFIELGKLLKKKYGNKMIDFIPVGDETYLYGDKLISIDIVKEFRESLRN